MVRGVHETLERQNREAFPAPGGGPPAEINFVLGAGAVFETQVRVDGYAAVDLWFVSDVAGSVEVFERKDFGVGQPAATFARTLGPVASVASIDQNGVAVEVIARRITPTADVMLLRYTNGGGGQAFFNSGSKALPVP